jgi:hypothetical protein
MTDVEVRIYGDETGGAPLFEEHPWHASPASKVSAGHSTIA